MLIVFARSNEHLRELIAQEIEKQGIHANLNHIEIHRVKNLDGIFKDSPFNGDISKWEFGFARSANSMFENSAFNGDISKWNTSVLESAESMFKNSKFTGDISQWDTRRLKIAYHMFKDSLFNGDISNWNMGRLEVAYSMFENSAFNGDISRWDVSNAKDTSSMFKGSEFNGDLSKWNVGQVRSMESMFENAPFNQDLSAWNVEHVVTMRRMFKGSPFNQDISQWKLSSVRDMSQMFEGSAFNRSIAQWDFSNMSPWGFAKFNREDSHKEKYSTREQVQQDAGAAEFSIGGVSQSNYERPAYSCLAMFKDSAFAQDISTANMPFDAGIDNLFSGNEKGLAAQGVSPWMLRLHLQQGSSPSDPMWKQKVQALRAQQTNIKEFAGVCALAMWREVHGLAVPQRQPEQPRTAWELVHLVKKEMLEQGPGADLNHIDVSKMVSLCGLFKNSNFTGDISSWDVSGVYDMRSLFENCPFNGDISNWNVSTVGQMDNMFKGSQFNGDISRWNVKALATAFSMFESSVFNGDLGQWSFKHLIGCHRMFANSAFNQDIGQWVLPSTFGQNVRIANYDARMCGVTTPAQFAQLWTTPEGKKIWQARQHWLEENKEFCNANEMFAGAAFKQDISSWDLMKHSNAGMFKDNDAGLAAQALSPWLLRYLLDEKKPLPDPELEKLWAPARTVVCALFASTQDQAQETWTMLQHELSKSQAPALEINDFQGFSAA